MGLFLICSHRPLQMTHLVAVLMLRREYEEPRGIRIARQRVSVTAGRKIEDAPGSINTLTASHLK